MVVSANDSVFVVAVIGAVMKSSKIDCNHVAQICEHIKYHGLAHLQWVNFTVMNYIIKRLSQKGKRSQLLSQPCNTIL